MEFRNKLFALRDKLINLKLEKGNALDNVAFDYLMQSINSSINILPYLSIQFYFEAGRSIANDPQVIKSIEKKMEIIEHAESSEIKDIYNKMTIIVTKCFVWNTGGWIIYLIPLATIAITLRQMGLVAFGLTKRIRTLIFAPEKKLHLEHYQLLSY